MPKLKLTWHGPLDTGTYPENRDDIAALGLESAGVYLMVQTYPRVTAIYVGKSLNLYHRIHEHLANIMGFRYWRRMADPTPRHAFEAELENAPRSAHPVIYRQHEYCYIQPEHNGLGQFRSLALNADQAIAEVRRTKFYYCRCGSEPVSDLSPPPHGPSKTIIAELEAQLIWHAQEFSRDNPALVCDNSRQESHTSKLEVDTGSFYELLETVTST